jgi:hypothetical protein
MKKEKDINAEEQTMLQANAPETEALSEDDLNEVSGGFNLGNILKGTLGL